MAVIINCSAIGFVSEASPEVRVARQSGARAAGPAMLLVAARDEPAAVPPDLTVTRAASTQIIVPNTHRRLRPMPPPPIAQTTSPAAPTESPSQPIVFYTFREVDEPAFPINDWGLDIETLDRIGVERLAFEVLVSDRGEIIGCTVLEPAELPEETRRSLEKRISETPLLPAQRAGERVASVRRIELSLVTTPLAMAAAASARLP